MSIEKLNTIWPDWKLVKQIGEGSFGKVYKVIREEFGITSLAAIKVISVPQNETELKALRAEGYDEASSKSYLESIVADFVKEIVMMVAMKGTTNIVTLEDYRVIEKTGEIGWDIFIRMELLKSFIDYNEDNTLDETDVIKLGQDICTALELCAKQGIIHRDIKPENIFVSTFGDYKIGDFGVARELEKTKVSMSAKGTYSYIAPEVVTSNEYDATVDIYSLGLVLYKLLNNNRLPFLPADGGRVLYHDRKDAIDRRLSGESLPAPVEANPKLAKVIQKACAFDPAMRYKTATELKKALESVKTWDHMTPEQELDETIQLHNKPEVDASELPDIDETMQVRPPPEAERETDDSLPEDKHSSKKKTRGKAEKPEKSRRKVTSFRSWWKQLSKRTKLITGAAVLLIIGLAVFLLIRTPGGKEIIIGGKTYDVNTTHISLSEAPPAEDLEKFNDFTDLKGVSLRYNNGINNEILKVIGEIPGLKNLSLGNCYADQSELLDLDFSLLKNSTNLSILELYCLQLTDISTLGDVKSLEKLSIVNTPVSELSALKELPSLIRLQINGSADDISSLSGISTLVSANLSNNLISDISPLSNCIDMYNLNVSSNRLESLNGLENLTKLSNLKARDNFISDISALSETSSLKDLYLCDNEITDISPLSKHEKLIYFVAENNNIESLEPLAACIDLIKITVNNNNLTNLNGLEELIYLEEIYAANNKLTSIDGLTNSTQLRSVNFNHNQLSNIMVLAKSADKLLSVQMVNNYISDITALRGTTALEILALDENAISDLSPLQQSVNIMGLFLHDNQIENIDALSGMTKMFYLDLSGNQVVDISSVSGMAEPDITIDISDNNVSNITLLPDGRYTALFIYGNPIRDIERLKDLSIPVLAFTYNENIDFSPLHSIITPKVFYSVDTPLDKQVNFKNSISENTFAIVKFVSHDEINAFKQGERDKITGVIQPSDSSDTTDDIDNEDIENG